MGNFRHTYSMGVGGYVLDTGAADAYVVQMAPAVTNYTAGLIIVFLAGATNTGASTLTLNGLTAQSIVKGVSTPLSAGDITVGQVVSVIYDGTNFQLSMGTTGLGGISGYSGFSGVDGLSGYSGFSGNSGYSGFSGVDGTSGYSGFSGKSGYSGFSGTNGATGTSGYSGYSGISGYSGFSGISGWSGISGYSGFSGIDGASGISGYSGFSGKSGYSGFSGTNGATGTSGYSGFSGTNGSNGATGTSGYSGFSGTNGSNGATGTSGYSGFSGTNGSNGATGTSGYSGFSGISGWSGYSGFSGISGYSGFSGISGWSGYSGFSGKSGYSGFSGLQGGFGGDSQPFLFNTNTANSPAGTRMNFDNSTYSSVGLIRMAYTNRYSVDIQTWLSNLGTSTNYVKGTLRIFKESDSSIFADYNFWDVQDNGSNGYEIYTSTYLGSNGAFAQDDNVVVTFARAGNSGYSGFSGKSGYSGSTGSTGTSGYSGFSGKSGYSGFSGVMPVARVQSVSSAATVTPNADADDLVIITAQAAALTLASPTGSPVQGQQLVIRIKDNATARAITWNAIYRASDDLALPTTTTVSKTMYIGFIYNSTDTKWDLVSLINNFS